MSKAYFNTVATEWDTMRQNFFPESVRTTIYANMDGTPGQTVIDVGAGTGFLSEGLLEAGYNIIAVDQSEEMLKQMQQKFIGSQNITYIKADQSSLNLVESSADFIVANMFLHHVSSPQQIIKEIVSALKPGGKLIITDLDEHTYEFLRTEQHDVWLGFDRNAIKTWFENAGLKAVSVNSIGCNCCSDSNASCNNSRAEINIFIASGEKTE